jgi:hypothetical protein
MLMLLASSVALAASAPVHSAEITHPARAYSATWAAQPVVHFRQVNPLAAMRQVHPMCRWSAQLTVNRAVASNGAAVPAMDKAVHSFRPVSGVQVGRCEDQQRAIAAEVARYSDALSGEAADVARRDHGALRAELDSFHALAPRG